jgi:hypothetical protein
MEAVSISETSVYICETTRLCIAEGLSSAFNLLKPKLV